MKIVVLLLRMRLLIVLDDDGGDNSEDNKADIYDNDDIKDDDDDDVQCSDQNWVKTISGSLICHLVHAFHLPSHVYCHHDEDEHHDEVYCHDDEHDHHSHGDDNDDHIMSYCLYLYQDFSSVMIQITLVCFHFSVS